jgi:serine/threonine-protein kinase
VLTIEPDLSKLSPAISPRLRTLIARCLERDLRHRWQAIGDVRIELETIQADPRSLVGDVVRDPLSRRAIPLVATAMLVGVFVAAVTRARPEQSQPQTTRFSLPLAPGQRFTEHGRHIIAVSPDGSRIAFVANDRLIVREMADANLEQLPVSNWDLGTPLFSPDGRWIAFFADRRLQKVAVTGGAPVVICEMLNPFGASWGEDDYILVGQGPGGIQRVSASGGKPETVVTVKPGEVAHGPQMLPDGEHLLFTLATGGTGSERWDRAQIVVQSLRSGERKVVIRDGSDARYVGSSGRIIYAYGATLRAIPFDLKRLEVTGDPEPIVDGVRRASVDSATGAAQFGLSATGTLAYILGGVPPTHRTVALIDMSGRATVLDTLPGLNYTPRFSADGRQIAWQGGDGNIWIYDRGGTNAKRKLTFDGTSRAPVWSPDARIVFQSGRGGDGGLFWQRADGSAPAERLTNFEPGFVDIPTSVSTDGKTLLFLRRRDSVRADAAPSAEPEGVYVLALEGSRTARVLIEASNDDASYGAPAFSPDGRWIVYQRGGVPFVEPFPSTGARYQITSERSWAPMWSPDGGRVVYLTGPNRRRFVAVDVFRKEPSFEHGPPMLLFEVQEPVNTFGEGGRIADMSPDGKYIVAIQDWLERDAEPGPSRIDVVLNWLEELKQRVPTR